MDLLAYLWPTERGVCGTWPPWSGMNLPLRTVILNSKLLNVQRINDPEDEKLVEAML